MSDIRVAFYLKGGQVLEMEFTEFSLNYLADQITNIKWKTGPGKPVLGHVVLSEIAAIVEV